MGSFPYGAVAELPESPAPEADAVDELALPELDLAVDAPVSSGVASSVELTELSVDDLPELLAEAQVVSLHVPLTPETTRLLDAAAFARMPVGAVLVNTDKVDGYSVAVDAAIDRITLR